MEIDIEHQFPQKMQSKCSSGIWNILTASSVLAMRWLFVNPTILKKSGERDSIFLLYATPYQMYINRIFSFFFFLLIHQLLVTKQKKVVPFNQLAGFYFVCLSASRSTLLTLDEIFYVVYTSVGICASRVWFFFVLSACVESVCDVCMATFCVFITT